MKDGPWIERIRIDIMNNIQFDKSYNILSLKTALQKQYR